MRTCPPCQLHCALASGLQPDCQSRCTTQRLRWKPCTHAPLQSSLTGPHTTPPQWLPQPAQRRLWPPTGGAAAPAAGWRGPAGRCPPRAAPQHPAQTSLQRALAMAGPRGFAARSRTFPSCSALDQLCKELCKTGLLCLDSPAVSKLGASGTAPASETRPWVGRNPRMPQWQAGTRTLPPVSPPAAVRPGQQHAHQGCTTRSTARHRLPAHQDPHALLGAACSMRCSFQALPAPLLELACVLPGNNASPRPMSASPAATAAAVPEDDPPGMRPGAAGLAGVP